MCNNIILYKTAAGAFNVIIILRAQAAVNMAVILINIVGSPRDRY